MADKRAPTTTQITISYQVPGQPGVFSTTQRYLVEKDIEDIMRLISGSLTKDVRDNDTTERVRNRVIWELRDPMTLKSVLERLQLLDELTFALKQATAAQERMEEIEA